MLEHWMHAYSAPLSPLAEMHVSRVGGLQLLVPGICLSGLAQERVGARICAAMLRALPSPLAEEFDQRIDRALAFQKPERCIG